MTEKTKKKREAVARRIEEEPGYRSLGRHLFHDPGNFDFPAIGTVVAEDAPLRTRRWNRGVRAFDQGNESSCTMQAAAGVLFTPPFRQQLVRPEGETKTNYASYNEADERYEGYRRAQNYDPWEGTYEGSSTDAPFRMLREEKRIREWRWYFGIEQLLRGLSDWGPAAIGVNWYSGMDQPMLPGGFITPTGYLRGGHAVELLAIDVTEEWVEGINSWGTSWGINGRFRLRWADLDKLLREDGEAVTVVL